MSVPNPIISSEPMRNAVNTNRYAPVWMHNLLGLVTGSFPATPEWKAIFAKHLNSLIDDYEASAPEPVAFETEMLALMVKHLDKPTLSLLTYEHGPYEITKVKNSIMTLLNAVRRTPAPEPQPEVAAEPVAWPPEKGSFVSVQFKVVNYCSSGNPSWISLIAPGISTTVDYEYRDTIAFSPPVVEEAVKANPWQDIATAPPTDHMNQILLAWKHRPASTGWWDIDHDFADRPEGWVPPEEGWRSYGDQCIPVEDGWPTHWQPLPAPPARSATP